MMEKSSTEQARRFDDIKANYYEICENIEKAAAESPEKEEGGAEGSSKE